MNSSVWYLQLRRGPVNGFSRGFWQMPVAQIELVGQLLALLHTTDVYEFMPWLDGKPCWWLSFIFAPTASPNLDVHLHLYNAGNQ